MPLACEFGPSSPDEGLEADVSELTQALGEAALQSESERTAPRAVWPFEVLEVSREQAGMRDCCRSG